MLYTACDGYASLFSHQALTFHDIPRWDALVASLPDAGARFVDVARGGLSAWRAEVNSKLGSRVALGVTMSTLHTTEKQNPRTVR